MAFNYDEWFRAGGGQGNAPMTNPQGEPLDYAGPNDAVSKQEANLYYPQGVPDSNHRGALGDLTQLSMQQLGNQAAAPAPGEGSQAGSGVSPYGGGDSQSNIDFVRDAPDQMAKADRMKRKAAEFVELGHSVGYDAGMAARMST